MKINLKSGTPNEHLELQRDGTHLVYLDELSASSYKIVEVSSQDYAKVYKLQNNGQDITGSATINIPKDMVVSAGEVKTCTQANVPVQGLAVGDKYIDLTIANATTDHIYIPVKDLMDVYTEGNGIDISASNVVSIQLDSTNANGLATTSAGLKLNTVTQSAAGAMSAADKIKLDGLVSPTSCYWATEPVSSAAVYNADPEIQKVTINGNASASAASTDHCVITYDTTNKCLKFTF